MSGAPDPIDLKMCLLIDLMPNLYDHITLLTELDNVLRAWGL